MGFAHLHLHTQYSLLDGANKITELIPRVKKLGMPAVAMTDHGNMFGAVEFYKTAVAAGVQPIIGCEMYVAPGDRRDKQKVVKATTSRPPAIFISCCWRPTRRGIAISVAW